MRKTMTWVGFFVSALLLFTTPSFGQSKSMDRAAFGSVPAVPHVLDVDKAAGQARATAFDETLLYYDLTRPVVIPVDLGARPDRIFRAVILFFEAPFDGTVDRVDFSLENRAPSPGIRGTGTLRIKLIEGAFVLTDPIFQPGIDSVDVDFSALAARQFPQPGNFVNQIDLSSGDFEIVKDEQYVLQLAVVDASNDAALTFLFDGGSTDTTDTRYFPARSLIYVDSLDVDAADVFFSIRNSAEPAFVNANLLLELQLTKAPPPPAAVASMQFVHNVPGTGPVDVYVGDSLVVEGLDFRQATSRLTVLAGEQRIDLVAAGDPDNGNPILSKTVTLIEQRAHWAVALGALGQNLDVVVKPISGDRSEDGKTFLVIAHGGNGADAVDFRILDETPPMMLVDDLAFGQFTDPIVIETGIYNIEVLANDARVDVFRLEIGESNSLDAGAKLVLTSGTVGGDPALALLTVDGVGNVEMPAISTATEDRDVPGRFALHGNYPNPFNPETTIRFDVASAGFTRLAVFNLLGQEVATLVAEPLAVGAYGVVFDATGLPSGPYIYRLTADGYVQQRTLMVLK